VQTVSWHLGAPVSTGSFSVWAVNQTTGGWYLVSAGVAAVTGQSDYPTSWTVNAPPANYRLTLWYLSTTGVWTNLRDSSAVLMVF